MATAQNGWPASPNKAALEVDSNFAVAGVKFPGGVKAGDVSTVLRYVAEQFHARVEPLRDGWCWGYAYRDVRGGKSLSNHSAACAIDINAPTHPLGKRGTFSASQKAAVIAIVEECGGVVRWGGSFSRPDEMHFEVIGTVGAVAKVAARLRNGNNAAVPIPSGTLLKKGSKGREVERLQRTLNSWYPDINLVVDGDFGPATEAAVRELQRRAKLTVDGIAGPKTLAVIGM